MEKVINFFKTDTGKKVEAAIWEIMVLALGIAICYAEDFNIVWLLPYVGIMNRITKFINIKFIKDKYLDIY